MINIFNLSISMPTLTQLISIVLTIFNLFIIFRILENKNKTSKLFYYICLFLAAHVFFSFLWSLIFEEHLTETRYLWERIRELGNSPMYDVITFNLIFLAVVAFKLETGQIKDLFSFKRGKNTSYKHK